VGPELDGEAAEDVEGVPEQEQLALGVDPGPLRRAGRPGGPDLQPGHLGLDVQVGRHADDGAGAVVPDRERQSLPGGLLGQLLVDVAPHLLR
jgi:hypothetical protein